MIPGLIPILMLILIPPLIPLIRHDANANRNTILPHINTPPLKLSIIQQTTGLLGSFGGGKLYNAVPLAFLGVGLRHDFRAEDLVSGGGGEGVADVVFEFLPCGFPR